MTREGPVGPGRDATYLVLEPDADGWRASNGGNCWRLSPVLLYWTSRPPDGAAWPLVLIGQDQ